ncbi:hypothetical protein ABZ490_29715 [Streptomyces sp. NPDC005811]|uniref:hypothetical protein n=1 Tax=Streptomyces sp. NPDC005811 TaxID=3154565 RepID=UPI0033FF62F6
MSAIAASAAGLINFARGGVPRRRLRSVPAQAGPVVPLEVGNPLQLTETMRARLLAAVRALVSDPALDGAGDPARLAAVVLMAKAKVATNYRATITAKELGRWVGLKPSRIAHHVLPQLRDRGVLGSNETVSAAGRVTGLECWVIPMYRAQHGGDRRHVLALSRVELVVLLALIETLFAPGWNHKDGRTTPAGMLAERTGRGAATDRLGLLLMVLSSNAKGWLQLCSGSVDTERGRPAATVARLLGCSPAGGAKVLSRLREQDVLSVDRRETASGLNARSRVRMLPVAQAHGIVVREAREAADAMFSDLAVTASGDHEATVEAVPPVVAGVQGAGEGLGADSADRADAAHLHASHASGVTPGGSLALSGGFSGEGRGGEGRRPEHVCVREDQAVGGEDAAAASESTAAEAGPLRGEKPRESPADEREGQQPAAVAAGARPKAAGGGKTQQQGRVALPKDLGVQVALAPVAGLWERLNGWQQQRVEAAAAAELGRLADLLMLPRTAPRLLADRLTDRLEETGGEALVNSPFGWITRKGLVRRPACSDVRCDDGIRLDTGGECDNCGNVIHIRRARRAKIAADIDRELPGLGTVERRRVLKDRLREYAAAEAEDLVVRREQARAVQARRDAVRAAAREQAERERQAEAAAEAVRQAMPCADCGQDRSAGLCEACGYRRRTEAAIGEAGMVAATWSAALDDAGDVAAVTAHVRATLEAAIKATHQQFLELMEPGDLEADPIAAASVLAFNAFQAVEQALPEYRSSALGRLGRAEEAEAEARRAYKTEQGRRWYKHNPTGADAVAAATKAADAARERVAEYLLATRLEQLRTRMADRTEPAAPAPWSARLTELATRPLHGETAGAVIA